LRPSGLSPVDGKTSRRWFALPPVAARPANPSISLKNKTPNRKNADARTAHVDDDQSAGRQVVFVLA
jgi:hypothetical protein